MNKESKNMSINILGFGYVGSSHGFLCEKNKITFNVCDLEKKEGAFNYFNNIPDLVHFSENNNDVNYYIIAVPTPSDSEGNCDISIVKDVLKKLKENIKKETYVIIKSTLVPGTSSLLNKDYPELNIVFSPEFLREKTYKQDIYNAEFILLGVPPQFNMINCQKIKTIFKMLYTHNENIDIFVHSYEECELFKYTLNTYFATKITFFNEIYELCESMNVDYQKLKTLFKLDKRVGNYGTIVPGPDNEFFGYFLKCLPKEVLGMKQLQKNLGLSNELMTCIDKRNKYFNNKPVQK